MKKTTKKSDAIIAFALLSLIIWLAVPVPVLAYIDPSVATYMVQAVAGIVVALGAAVGIYFRKAKKKVQKTLNIDENANKEVESDEIVVDDSADDAGKDA